MITFEETPSYQMITFLILLILFLIHLDNRLASSSMRLCVYASMRLCVYASMRLCVYASMRLCVYRATELHNYTPTELRVHTQTVGKKRAPRKALFEFSLSSVEMPNAHRPPRYACQSIS